MPVSSSNDMKITPERFPGAGDGDDAGDAHTPPVLKLRKISRTVHAQALQTRTQQGQRMAAETQAETCVVRGNLLASLACGKRRWLLGRRACQRTGQALNTQGCQ